MEESE